jgi:hypothetical protein
MKKNYLSHFGSPPLLKSNMPLSPIKSYYYGTYSRIKNKSQPKPLENKAICSLHQQTKHLCIFMLYKARRRRYYSPRSHDSSVVQSVERRTVNPYVTGSSPVRGAIFRKARSVICAGFSLFTAIYNQSSKGSPSVSIKRLAQAKKAVACTKSNSSNSPSPCARSFSNCV